MSKPRQDRWPHTGAVLAGGLSTRMGQPKAHMRLPDGRTLLDAAIELLARVCRNVVVVGAYRGPHAPADAATPAPQRAPNVATVTRIADARPGHGPLGAIEALLASGLDTHYLVIPCDMPLLNDAVLGALLGRCDAAAAVLSARDEGDQILHPLPLRLRAGALDAVRARLDAGERSIHRLLESGVIPISRVELPTQWERLLVNINTPHDLATMFRDQPQQSE